MINQGAAGQGRRGEKYSEACRVSISPRRPCPVAPFARQAITSTALRLQNIFIKQYITPLFQFLTAVFRFK